MILRAKFLVALTCLVIQTGCGGDKSPSEKNEQETVIVTDPPPASKIETPNQMIKESSTFVPLRQEISSGRFDISAQTTVQPALTVSNRFQLKSQALVLSPSN
ncbi:hypothetical protein [Pseudoalteromonas denitrificans]|uniref:Uncharacterized protein n=1 Tax=Pseudoalteromonas denitrificans DSM 6059 TaxID=1123010 RepID=A0A1I1G8I4_9GAMM|nr:hypothetical protein [Pseudoalteromonas denitrificans]SFC07686.1 hypothetical protein SAMN02745724_00850 [Pseudoalteromonas denitrificans DSM 6059]